MRRFYRNPHSSLCTEQPSECAAPKRLSVHFHNVSFSHQHPHNYSASFVCDPPTFRMSSTRWCAVYFHTNCFSQHLHNYSVPFACDPPTFGMSSTKWCAVYFHTNFFCQHLHNYSVPIARPTHLWDVQHQVVCRVLSYHFFSQHPHNYSASFACDPPTFGMSSTRWCAVYFHTNCFSQHLHDYSVPFACDPPTFGMSSTRWCAVYFCTVCGTNSRPMRCFPWGRMVPFWGRICTWGDVVCEGGEGGGE